MTYEKIVEKVKKALAKVDASGVKGHLAVQVDVYGEGAFYIEVKDGKVKVNEGEYRFDEDRNTIVRTSDGEAIGCGKFTIKQRKDRKNGEIITEIYIEPVYINDYEIIPHHFNQDENQREIDSFMQKYVFKPFKLGDNTIGVELNFNKEFYMPEETESVEDVMTEIKLLNDELLTIGI